MRWTSLKGLLALSVAGVTALGGCNCGEPPEDCMGVAINFVEPNPAAQLTYGNDLDGNGSNGIQADVSVAVKDLCGKPAVMTSAKLDRRSPNEEAWGDEKPAELEEGKATFRGVTFRPGELLRVRVVQQGRDTEHPKVQQYNVFDPNARPVVTEFRFQQDLNGDRLLNASELTGGAAPVAVLKTSNAVGTVEIQDELSAVVFGTGTVAADGTASVELSGLPDKTSGSYSLVAVVKNAIGLENKRKDATAEDPLNAPAFATLRIDLVAPVVTILSPSKAIYGPADDADAAIDGFQLAVNATVGADSNAEVKIDVGDVHRTATHSAGSISETVTLNAAGTTEYTLRVTARDEGGNETFAEHAFTIDYDPPTVQITSPQASGGPYDTFTLTLTAEVTGADGQKVRFFTRPAGDTAVKDPLQEIEVQAGVASAQVTFPGGRRDILAEVEDAAGNLATDDELNVDIQGQGCEIVLSAPAGSPVTLMGSNDIDPNTAGLQFVVRGNSPNCPNAPVELFIDGTVDRQVNTGPNGDFVFPVSLTEGTHQVTTRMTDPFGAVNEDGSAVTVDITAPVLTFPSNNARLNASVDLQEQVPGAQQNLTYTSGSAAGTRVDVCINTQFNANASPCVDGSTGWFTLATNVQTATAGFTYPEGIYQLKLVESVGASFNATAPINLTVDTIRPIVTSFVFQGDANNDKRLNATESPSGSPVAIIGVSEPVTAVRVLNSKNTTGAPYGTSGAAAATANVVLNGAVGPEANYDLVAEITDAAGNRNVIVNATPVNPLNSAAFVMFRLDRVAPTVTLQAPTKTMLGIADDASSTTSGYQLDVRALTATDVKTDGVTITLSGTTNPSPFTPDASGTVSTRFTLPDTGTTQHTVTVTATDESGNAGAPATTTLTIDRDAPTIVLQAPLASGGPYGSFALPTTAEVTGARGSVVRVFTQVGTGPETELQPLPAVSVDTTTTTTGTVTYPNGVQTIRVSVTDTAGNTAQHVEPNVEVNGVGCSVLITSPTGSPAILNRSNDLNPSTPATIETTLMGSSSNCANRSVSLYRGTGSGRTLLAGPVTSNASGNFTFSFGLAEGSHVLEAEMNNGAGVMTTAQQSVVVDLTPPTLSNVSPSGATLFFVAQTNVNLIPTPTPGYIADNSPGGDAEVNVTLRASGAAGGTATVLYANQVVGGPVSIASDSETLSIPTVLPHGTTGQFVIRVVDAGGNEVTQTSSATVDVQEPGVPVVTKSLVPGQERRAQVALQWAPTFDDGNTAASGGHLGYDIRWTTNAVTENGITSEEDYFSTTLVKREPVVAWSGSTINHTLTLPPLASYSISVRAVDGVGNYSAFGSETALENYWSKVELTNPSNSLNQFYGFILESGKVDADANDDLLVAAQADGAGVVYIHFGGLGFPSEHWQDLRPPAAPNNLPQNFGADVSVGKPSDTHSAVLVGAPTWSAPPTWPSNSGRAFLYFGGTRPLDTTGAIEFRGSAAGGQLGRTARIIKDINGDAFDDIVLSAHGEQGGQGRVYVFFGRPRGTDAVVGSWLYLQAINGGFVPISEADLVINGPTPVVAGGNEFGRNRLGVVSVGDLDALGGREFTIPASKGTVNRSFVFRGEAGSVNDAQRSLQTGGLPTVNDALQTLSAPPTGQTGRTGFGGCVLSGGNWVAGPQVDLVVTDGNAAPHVRIFPDGVASGFTSTPQTISGPGGTFFGQSCAAADINGDGYEDLAFGQNVVSNGSVFLFYNQSGVPGASSAFDSVVGSGFYQSRLRSSSSMGVAIEFGDFNGDGMQDLVAGDTNGAGKVYVWQ